MSVRKFIYDNHVLTGISTLLFPYEILLPGEYTMIYSGFEDLGNKYRNCDINIDLINSEKFTGIINIINLNPKSVPIVCTDPDYIDIDNNAISLYKHICIFSFMTYIKFDMKDKNIKSVITEYIMNTDDENHCHGEFMYVTRSDNDKENKFARVKY